VLVELSVMEQRYQAVLAVVQDGWKVVEVARRTGVSRQTLHGWIARYERGGLSSLADRSHRPDTCPATAILANGTPLIKGSISRVNKAVSIGGAGSAIPPPKPVATARTNSTGEFRFTGLRQGRWFVFVQNEPGVGSWVRVDPETGAVVTLVVCSGCPIRLHSTNGHQSPADYERKTREVATV
jgi:transposase-like protein